MEECRPVPGCLAQARAAIACDTAYWREEAAYAAWSGEGRWDTPPPPEEGPEDAREAEMWEDWMEALRCTALAEEGRC